MRFFYQQIVETKRDLRIRASREKEDSFPTIKTILYFELLPW